MALAVMDWATEDAPVANVYERLILVLLADRANLDGTDAYPSVRRLARAAMCSERTVQTYLRSMVERGLIARGNQDAARHIDKRYRPTVYDVLMPYSAYGTEKWKRANRERAEKGLKPLSPEDRPDIAPPPQTGRAQRSDKGKPNPKRSRKKGTDSSASATGTTPVTSGNGEGCTLFTPDAGTAEAASGVNDIQGSGVNKKHSSGVHTIHPNLSLSLREPVQPQPVPEPSLRSGSGDDDPSVRPCGDAREREAAAPASDARSADGRTDSPSEESNQPSAAALAVAEQLLAEREIEAGLRRLDCRTTQRRTLRRRVADAIAAGHEVDRVRGYLLAKFRETTGRKITFVIRAFDPEHAPDLVDAQAVEHADARATRCRAPQSPTPATLERPATSPVDWLDDAQFAALGPADRATLVAHGHRPLAELPKGVQARLHRIRALTAA